MRKRVYLLIILFLLLPFPINARTDSSNVPYIYYFSDKLYAFVVERADGTDTRILGDGLMALTSDRAYGFHIEGPGWSPSGKWFAWTAAQVYYGNQSGYKPYVVSADGKQRLTVLDSLENAVMAWSPKDDRLLVVSQQYVHQKSGQAFKTFIALINAAANAMTVLFNDTLPFYDEAFRNAVVWTSQGYGIAEYNAASTDSSNAVHEGFIVVSPQGKYYKREFRNVLVSDYYQTNPTISVTGNVAYLTDKSLVIENVITGKVQRLDKPSSVQLTIQWSPDGKYGLLFGDNAWLVVPESGTLEIVQEPLLQSDDPIIYEYPRPLWSPDGRQALFVSGGKLYHLDANTGKSTQLPINADERSSHLSWHWTADSHAIIGSYLDANYSKFMIYLYDAAKGITRQIDVGKHGADQFDMTSNGRYLAYMNEGAVIYDTQNRSSRELRPAADGFNSSNGGEVAWNKDGDWLLTFDDALVAGGGYYRYLGVVRGDGAVQRDLGFAVAPTDNTINWLPAQVNPDDLPTSLKKSLVPTPIDTLYGSEWTFVLSWSPDGKQIAGSGGDWWDDSQITVWDVTTKQSSEIPKADKKLENYLIDWQRDSTGQYNPALQSMPVLRKLQGRYVRAISPDGREAFVGTDRDDQPPGIYLVDTGRLVQQLGGSQGLYTSGSFSPDGRLLALGSPYEQSQIYDTQTWKVVATLPFAAPAVAFSPDGKQLAATSAWNIEIWDVANLLAR